MNLKLVYCDRFFSLNNYPSDRVSYFSLLSWSLHCGFHYSHDKHEYKQKKTEFFFYFPNTVEAFINDHHGTLSWPFIFENRVLHGKRPQYETIEAAFSLTRSRRLAQKASYLSLGVTLFLQPSSETFNEYSTNIIR